MPPNLRSSLYQDRSYPKISRTLGSFYILHVITWLRTYRVFATQSVSPLNCRKLRSDFFTFLFSLSLSMVLNREAPGRYHAEPVLLSAGLEPVKATRVLPVPRVRFGMYTTNFTLPIGSPRDQFKLPMPTAQWSLLHLGERMTISLSGARRHLGTGSRDMGILACRGTRTCDAILWRSISSGRWNLQPGASTAKRRLPAVSLW